MKKISMMILLMLAMILPAAARDLKGTTVRFSVNPPMKCNNCAEKIEKEVRRDKGVSRVAASPELQIVSVTYNPEKTSMDNLLKAFKKCGYEATELTDELMQPDLTPALAPAGKVRPRATAEPGKAPVKMGEKRQECGGCCGEHPHGLQSRGHNAKSENIEGTYQENGGPKEPVRGE